VILHKKLLPFGSHDEHDNGGDNMGNAVIVKNFPRKQNGASAFGNSST